ncbi:histone-lysine N-methyltransferase SETMAR [Trichonephila clavipes]|nr:histone-lysine N-methyltransferase SETMAR [Trichonephila clavipes]
MHKTLIHHLLVYWLHATWYCDTLLKLKEAIWKKRNGLLRSDVLLLDDSMTTQNHIASLGWEHLHHTPYSPDLTPSDFHLFTTLKKNFTTRHFGSNAEVKQAIKFFRMQSP